MVIKGKNQAASGLVGVQGTEGFPLVARAVDVNGIYVGSRAMFERMNQFLAKHQIHPVVDKTYAVAEAEKAYECLENAGHFGKVAIEF